MSETTEKNVRPRVLVTGAAGRVARLVIPSLAQRYSLRLLDKPGATFDGLEGFGEIYEADVTDAGPLFEDQDTIIHLAANPSPRAGLSELLTPNIVACAAMFEHAVAHQCRRVLYASSVQVAAGYPEGQLIPPAAAPSPTNPYGATKAFGEAYAHMVGSTTATSVVILRIGAVAGAPPDEDTSLIHLRPNDLIAHIVRALEWGGTGSRIVNAVSATGRFTSTTQV